MRIALALVVVLASSCAPMLSTYVAPTTATNLKSMEISDESMATAGIARNGANILVFSTAADTPGRRRIVTYNCADGFEVRREVVSDTIDPTRATLGVVAVGSGAVILANEGLRVAQGFDGNLVVVIVGLTVLSQGAAGLSFGWHPAPATLVDTFTCAGHDAPAPAPEPVDRGY